MTWQTTVLLAVNCVGLWAMIVAWCLFMFTANISANKLLEIQRLSLRAQATDE